MALALLVAVAFVLVWHGLETRRPVFVLACAAPAFVAGLVLGRRSAFRRYVHDWVVVVRETREATATLQRMVRETRGAREDDEG